MHQDFPELNPHASFLEEASVPVDPERVGRELFIPLNKSDLVRILLRADFLPSRDRRRFLKVCGLLDALSHREAYSQLDTWKQSYAPFDPDADTKPLEALSDREREALASEVFDRFAYLLDRANFRRMSEEELAATVNAASDWGLHLKVDMSVFRRLEIFVRGDVLGRRVRHRWQNFYRPEEIDVPTFQRLVVLFRLNAHHKSVAPGEPEWIHVKLFKNIPKLDVDMLLPGTQVRMTLIDQCQILLPTVTGVGMALFKIVKGLVIVASLSLYGVLALLGFVGGTIGYGVRSFVSYLRTKDRYQLNLTRSLYFQNLASNAGVFFRLLDEAQMQEFREAAIAYYLLVAGGPPEGWTEREIDEEAESFLKTYAGLECDFEVADAVRKLQRWGVVELVRPSRWRALPLEEAIRRLERQWDCGAPSRCEDDEDPFRREFLTPQVLDVPSQDVG